MENRLILSNIHAGYGSVRVLHDISVHVTGQEIVVLLGTNGNGKSTLMKCVMGEVRPKSGEIHLERDGQRFDLTQRSTEEVVNLGICLIPEGRRLFPTLTVKENLVMGAFRAMARSHLERNLSLCNEIFPILQERKGQLAGTLSGGEQQMLAIARAVMSNPQVLLVDEPSVGLAPIFVSRVIENIKQIQERYNLSVLMTEQNFTQAVKIADRGYIIVEGKIEFEGRTKAELSENELVKKYYLGV